VCESIPSPRLTLPFLLSRRIGFFSLMGPVGAIIGHSVGSKGLFAVSVSSAVFPSYGMLSLLVHSDSRGFPR